MVTITNGIDTFRVTAGAVKLYESMGFHITSDSEVQAMHKSDMTYGHPSDVHSSVAKRSSADTGSDEEEVDEDALFIEEILEKPLSQWTNDEVKEFVRIKDIDTSGAQKVSQVRGIIKNYLEEQQKNA